MAEKRRKKGNSDPTRRSLLGHRKLPSGRVIVIVVRCSMWESVSCVSLSMTCVNGYGSRDWPLNHVDAAVMKGVQGDRELELGER